MATKPHVLRKKLLINPVIQLKYFFTFAFLGGGLSGVWGYLVLSAIHHDEVKLGLAAEGSSLTHIHGGLFWWLSAVVVVLTLLIGTAGLVITHGVAGPVFVMGQAIDTLASGKYPHLRPLRKSDDLKDLYASLRALVESLLKTERDELAAIEKALELISKAEGGNGAEASALLQVVHAKKLERVNTAIPLASPPAG